MQEDRRRQARARGLSPRARGQSAPRKYPRLREGADRVRSRAGISDPAPAPRRRVIAPSMIPIILGSALLLRWRRRDADRRAHDRASAPAGGPLGRGRRLAPACCSSSVRRRPAAADRAAARRRAAISKTCGWRLASGWPRAHRVILVDRPGQGWSERRKPAHDVRPPRRPRCCAMCSTGSASRAQFVVGHSWGGTLALAFALDHPDRVAGLVLLAPPTHPWPRRHRLALSRCCRLPLARMAVRAHCRAAAVGGRATGRLCARAFRAADAAAWLRQAHRGARCCCGRRTFLANARDVAGLKAFLTAQSPRYGGSRVPTVIITGDRDTVVSPRHPCAALAAALPAAKLSCCPVSATCCIMRSRADRCRDRDVGWTLRE